MNSKYRELYVVAAFYLGVIVGVIPNDYINGREIKWEYVTGISALFIATCALYVSFYIARETIRHNKISIKPQLTTYAFVEHDYIGFELRNRGLGPAIIQNVKVCKGEAEYEWSKEDEINRYLSDVELNDLGIGHTRIQGGTIILPNEGLKIIVVETETLSDENFDTIVDVCKNILMVKVNYTSAYGVEDEFEYYSS